MTTEAFRNAVQADIEAWRLANYPEIPAFYENSEEVDEASVGQIFIDVQVRWYGSKFVTVGVSPRGRHSGTVVTNVYYRAGEGTALPDQVIDSLIAHLQARRLGDGVLYMPARSTPTDFFGWPKYGLLTPFTLG